MMVVFPWAVAVVCLLGWAANALVVRRRMAQLVGVAERTTGGAVAGSMAQRLSRSVKVLVDRNSSFSPRLAQLHSITGLPTREPLFARMATDGEGLLALLAFKDYDRLCGFDPHLGDRMLVRLVERVQAMLSSGRFLAHVDRVHLAIWTAGPPVDATGAELDALLYALGDRLVDEGCEILPEIVLRRIGFDAGASTPPSALTRALASFGAGEPDLEAVDPQAVARDRFALEQDLRQAVARGELLLHFQPLVDASEHRVCGAEALIRWEHPARGLVPPSRFVPVMEEVGLSDEIGLWTLNAAVRETRLWASAGLGALRVAVNVSGHQLERQDLALLVERTLARHSAGADALEIELTESVAMGDGASAARLFGALHELGVKIAIDDFGTGFSSLSTLRTLSFDKIKIDREFVTGVHVRRDSQAICQSVLALGRGLGIQVLAEGVEHRAEYAWLRRHGCHLFQGFYFSPPLPRGEFTEFVRDGERLACLLALDPDDPDRRFSERRQA
jgi:Amt family ammonium transporter